MSESTQDAAVPRQMLRTDVPFVASGATEADAVPAIVIRDANLFYDAKQALFDISMDIHARQVTAFIGPSGCGKSTLLRCLNRMNDLIDNVRITGTFSVHGQDLYDRATDVIEVRRRIGMVFQKSNPLPKSIYENVVYGLRIAGIKAKATLDEACEKSLQGRSAVGGSQGPPPRERAVAVRRAATAAVHRPGHCHRAGDRPHGRTLLRPRPDRDAEGRRTDGATQDTSSRSSSSRTTCSRRRACRTRRRSSGSAG